MAHVKSISLIAAPNGSAPGSGSPRHVSVYECGLDVAAPAFFALRHCQGHIAGTTFPGGGQYKVPKFGDRFLFDAIGNPVLDTGQSQADFTAAHPQGYADFGAFALDFAYASVDTCSYRFTVTHRPYESKGFESAGFVAFFEDFSVAKIPLLPPNSTSVADIETATTSVPSFTSIRWIQGEVETSEAFVQNTFDSNFSATPVTLRNPNEDVYQPRVKSKRIQIARRVFPTRDTATALSMDRRYRDTINNATVTIDGQVFAKHHVRWLGVDVSDPISTGGSGTGGTYTMTTYEVEVSEIPFYERIPAVGAYAFADVPGLGLQKITDKDTDGFQVAREFPLKSDGTLATVIADQHVDTIKDYRDEDYSGLF